MVGLALWMVGAPEAASQSLTLSGNPQALVISTAVAGLGPDPVEDQGTTYSVQVLTTSRIEAQLDSALPPGVSLWVRLAAPPGATTHGWVQLSTTPQVVVSDILLGSYSGLMVEYRLTTTVAAGVVPLNSRQVSFTLRSIL